MSGRAVGPGGRERAEERALEAIRDGDARASAPPAPMDGPPRTEATPVVGLEATGASDAALSGAKAANLARCRAAGLPTLPGFVVTTEATAVGLDDPVVERAVRDAWEALSRGGTDSLVVRSSSTIEDAASSSMAGRFTSVLEVVGWPAFRDAVERVLDSAVGVRDDEGRSHPMAVLVQPQLEARLGGVLFGVDPVTGDRRRFVVETVAGGPDALVSGRVNAAHLVLGRRGRVVEVSGAREVTVSSSLRRGLARLARAASRALGTAQDVEWAQDLDGSLWLLQSRPVTAVAEHGGGGHRFGPGPVAETFPAPLHRLEDDLWITPLREGIARALRATGAASARRVAASPVVTTVGGWAAVDLDLLGVGPRSRSALRYLNPTPSLRRLVAAWAVGRLRVALPRLAAELVGGVDADLAAVPPLRDLSEGRLLGVCERARTELAAVHTLEVLAGMLLHGHATGPSAAALALAAVAEGRAKGMSDGDIVAGAPVVLALTAPAIGATQALPEVPPVATDSGGDGGPEALDVLDARDALRLRSRWLQELTALAATELGARLAGRAALPDAGSARDLDLDELSVVVAGGPPPADLADRAAGRFGAPLPPAFHLTVSGEAVPARHAHAAHAAGVPAGGGRVSGRARHRVAPGSAREGNVLVVAHLEPELAAVLPSLDGLVSETGGALSHLAILAREMGVPTVVGVADARRRFPPGVTLLVDGATGEVEVLDGAEGRR